MDPFVGEIRLFPWGWAPQGWLVCEGQILPFQQYVALASLLGTRFGGNGSTTFGLPDLRGRVALGMNPVASTNPLLNVHAMGSSAGTETVTLGTDALPAHTHTAYVADAAGTMGPAGGIPAISSNSTGAVFKPTYVTANTTTPPTDLVNLNGSSVVPTQGLPMENMQPSIVGCFCIATSGLYPPRP
ncbi:phage tail protein [Pseudomonas sp. PH1b]|uniref:phage tail protein n=1 Tax=Pseudomonas sp. PH1b TaxID=1397282 RepID=UPI00046ABF5C|nr:tail fiber protein [Pseudomonas sp. PH1b]BFD42592.1 tail fiber protein [Pseudomonas sp. FFPRI_1]